MTFREKLKREHPYKCRKNARGGCEGCPADYGYEEAPSWCDCKGNVEDDCVACWDREIPDTEPVAAKCAPVVYISGPITGVPQYWEPFSEAEDDLVASGFVPLNPARLPHGLSNEQYMAINIAQINAADAIYFLPGSYKSGGAVLEHHYASYIGKPTFHSIKELKEFFENTHKNQNKK